MQDDAVEIESNMMASGKLKMKIETRNRENRRFREQAGPSGSGKSSYDKMDDMARIIKELSNKISRMEIYQSKDDKFVKREFGRNPNPQIQQRQIKNEDQKIQTPLKNENFIGGNDMQEFEELEEDVKHLGDDCIQPHLMKEDYEKSLNTKQSSGEDNSLNSVDDPAYQGMVDTIIVELQHKYNLRPKNKPVLTAQPKKILPRGKTYEPAPKETEVQARGTKTVETQTLGTASTENKKMQTNRLGKREFDVSAKEIDRVVGGFHLENEISKIKILIPLVELAKNPLYRKQITKMINFADLETQSDVINLEYDKPNITFGPHFKGARDTVAPFLNVHDRLLHNCMLDFGASHNVMPKSIMDGLGLEITRPYGDLYLFDSRRVKRMGIIKDLVVTLAQILVKNVLMDVVIADIPQKYGFLLSRSQGAKLEGSLQLDMTYATIPIFGGQFTWLYKETQLAYTISDPQNPNNYPVYVADQDLGNCILSFDNSENNCTEESYLDEIKTEKTDKNVYSTGTWKMFFDGASSCEGAGA
jgi:hypothetical protein